MTPTNHKPAETAPNTRRPWHRRANVRAAATIATGGALAIADTIHGMTHASSADKLAAALAMLSAFALMARGAFEIRPSYRRPDNTAAQMDD